MSDDIRQYRDRLLKTIHKERQRYAKGETEFSEEKEKAMKSAITHLEGSLVDAGVITSEEFVHHHENIGALDHEEWYRGKLEDDRLDNERLTDGEKERIHEVLDDPDL